MGKLAALLLTVSLCLAADKDVTADPWQKVKDLKTGSDLRIFKTGASGPITAKSADVTERKFIVIIGNAETAINKSEIDHVDYRPPAGKPVRTKSYDASSDSASMSISSSTTRDGWRTIYQRPPAK